MVPKLPRLGLVVVAFAFAACNSGDKVEKVDADDWIEDLCAATLRLSDAEADAFDAYFELFAEEDEEIRAGFDDYVSAYDRALDRFSSAVERAGQPDVEDGEKLTEAVFEWVKQEHRGLDRAERDVKALEETGVDLVDAIDERFFEIEPVDLAPILEDSDAPNADDIIETIDEDEACSNYLFSS